MKKWFKRGLFSLVVFVIVALVGAAVFLLTFDPNAYKNKVEQLVYERYQRHLKIEGDIELSLFPRIGLAVEHVSLSDHSSDTTFASVDSARFAVAVWPLLWNKLVVDHVAVSGFKVWLQRDDQGQFNFFDLLQRHPSAPPTSVVNLSPIPTVQAENKSSSLVPDAAEAEFQIDIAGLDLKEGEIHFYDQSSAAQIRVVDLELNTGRMTFGQPFDVIFKGKLLGERPIADANLEGQALVQLEPHLYRYSAQKMNVSLAGQVGAYQAQSATLRGALEVLTHTQDLRARQLELVSQGRWHDDEHQLDKVQLNWTTGQLNMKRNLQVIQTERMQLRASGSLPMAEGLAEHKMEVALDVPKINIGSNQVQAEPLAFSFKQTHGSQVFGVNVRTKAIQGDLEQLEVPDVQLNVAGKHGVQAWKVDTLSSLRWLQNEQLLAWQDLNASVVLDDSRLKPNPAQAKLTGAGEWALAENKAWFEGTWDSANTHAQLRSDLTHEDHWLLSLKVEAPEIDFNPWLPKTKSAAVVSEQTGEQVNESFVMLPSYVDWAGLHTQLQLNTQTLSFSQLQLHNVQATLEQQERSLFLRELVAEVFDGNLQAEAQWQYANDHLQLKTELDQVDLAQLSSLYPEPFGLAGVGSVRADLHTQGPTVGAKLADLDGSVHLQAESGQVLGWSIWQTLDQLNQAVRNVFGGQVAAPATQMQLDQQTAFNELTMQLQFQRGQGYFEQLQLDAAGLKLQAEVPSYLDIVNQRLELDLQLDLQQKTLPEAYQALSDLSTHPLYVRLSGPWFNPLFRVQWLRLEQPSVQEAMDHGLLGLFSQENSKGLPVDVPKASSNPEVGKTLGDTLKNLLKN